MAQSIKNLFPLGIATGAAHCNRNSERQELKNQIRSGAHTWLWARRRMGKTSLIEQVMRELGRVRPTIPSVIIDLNIVHDAESLETKIRNAAAELSIQLMPKQQKSQQTLQRVFERFRPEFTIGGPGLKMILRPSQPAASGIAEVLLALDAAAKTQRRRAVFVIDEFQQLSGLYYGKSDVTLEGSIRHAVERAEYISYVFSGSQRSLLADLFENPDRPLYRHCQKMALERITAEDYNKFINNAAKARWDKSLDDKVTHSILAITRRHPYYVNALCAELWRASEPPTKIQLTSTWKSLVARDAALAAQTVRTLSATQRAMLVGIALADSVEYPTGRAFLAQIRLSASTGSAAKRVLEEEDLIRDTADNHWELIDPVMAEYIHNSWGG